MKILISVATKHGATGAIGEVIADELRAAGHDVRTAAPESVSDLDEVDALVLGSAVYVGHWLKPARELAARLEGQLEGRPVWLFSSGPLGDPETAARGAIDVTALVEQTGAREHRVFAGSLSRDDLSWAEKAVVRAVKAPEGDFTDWLQVRAWAALIASQLTTETTLSTR